MGWLVAFQGRAEHRQWTDKDTDKGREAIDFVGQIQLVAAPCNTGGESPATEPELAGATSDNDIPF
jgi:hypothetical protein